MKSLNRFHQFNQFHQVRQFPSGETIELAEAIQSFVSDDTAE
jgi:hypothetical protein